MSLFLSSPLFVSILLVFLNLHLQLYSSFPLSRDLVHSSLTQVKTKKESRVCSKSLTSFYCPQHHVIFFWNMGCSCSYKPWLFQLNTSRLTWDQGLILKKLPTLNFHARYPSHSELHVGCRCRDGFEVLL